MALPELHQQRELVQTKSSREDGGKKHGPISFGFSKTLHEFKSDTSEKREYLTAVEGKELKGTKSADKPKGLVIPLIHKNRWYHKDAGREDTTTEDQPRREASSEPDTVESQAVRELIEESQKLQDKWENGPQTDPNFAIPLLMQNQAPQGFEDGDLIKLDLRPESSTDTDYEHVPVEAYGMAMLKGMGWREGEGIGRTLKQDVKPIENQLRPKGLGLGADRSAIKDLEPKRAKRPPKPGEERADEEEALVLGPGGCVLVLSGAHKDLYGKIEGVDADNARVVLKLAIGGKTVTVIQHSLKLVTQKEYGKYSKDLSRLSKAHKEKERDQTSNGRDQREKDRETRKKKHRESSPDRDKPPAAKEPRLSVSSWLQRDLRVRFIDKAFKDGRYYNSKMRVEDVLTPHTCVCRTDDGRVLDDIRQKMLETIVPKNDSDFIMVVLGEHRGQVGRILKRDREKCRAMVQLDRHEEQVFTLDYDTICHYVGGTEH